MTSLETYEKHNVEEGIVEQHHQFTFNVRDTKNLVTQAHNVVFGWQKDLNNKKKTIIFVDTECNVSVNRITFAIT